MTFLNRHRSRIRPVGPFAPSSLFFGGIPGAWYDPTDLSTMFQDSTGATPVTAVEQPVGLILDKSQGLVLGPELVTNGDFSSGITGWIAGNASWSVGGGKASNDGTNVVFASFRQNNVVTAGTFYLVEWDQVTTAGDLRLWFNGVQLVALSVSGTGRKSYRVQCTSTGSLFFEASIGAVLSIDNVTVKALPGNHASQSTAASRPTYRARYNALTQSEDFSQAVWTKVNANVSANSVTAPDGTTTADTLTPTAVLGYHLIIQAVAVTNGAAYTFSYYVRPNGYTKIALVEYQTTGNFVTFDLTGAGSVITASGAVGTIASVGGGWYRVTHTSNAGSGTFRPDLWVLPNSYVSGSYFFTWTPDGTSGVYVWGAQLLTAADVTATGNAYQRIAAATVYDTAPIFRTYLAFDGVDDSLATAAIDFTSTDKMTVFAGATKSSDAALGMVTELGNRNIVQAGSFSLTAPRNAGAPDYSFIVEGTAVTDNTIVTYIAPITNVMTARGDIAAPLNQLRVNGAVAGTLTTTLGTGNFGNWPLFIGRRNNTNLPFNGRIYELIVRGAASSTTEIIDTETWVNQRTGAF